MRSCLIFAVFLFQSAAGLAAPKAFYCDSTSTFVVDDIPRVAKSRAWIKSPTVYRIEVQIDRVKQTTIANGVDAWQIVADRPTAIHATQPPQILDSLNKKRRPIGDDLDAFLAKGARKAGQEKVDGVLCDVYRFHANQGDYALWVIPGSDRLTRKQEMAGKQQYATAPGQPMKEHTFRRTLLFNWKSGVAMPASLFRPPAGMKIVEAKPRPSSIPQYSPLPGQ